MSERASTLLSVQDLTASYSRGQSVISNVSFELHVGRVATIIGANGSGKSTLLRALVGMVPYMSGLVELHGERIDQLRTDERVRCGLVLVPQNRDLFMDMTVEENLVMGAYSRRRLFGGRKRLAPDLDSVYQLFTRLSTLRKRRSGLLSGGEQQMVAIGRGLMANPRLLLLDEPSIGLSPAAIDDLAERLATIVAGGQDILLVEQNAHLGLEIAQDAFVLANGHIVTSGLASELLTGGLLGRHYLWGDNDNEARRLQG